MKEYVGWVVAGVEALIAGIILICFSFVVSERDALDLEKEKALIKIESQEETIARMAKQYEQLHKAYLEVRDADLRR